jgi:hypothetical protein
VPAAAEASFENGGDHGRHPHKPWRTLLTRILIDSSDENDVVIKVAS